MWGDRPGRRRSDQPAGKRDACPTTGRCPPGRRSVQSVRPRGAFRRGDLLFLTKTSPSPIFAQASALFDAVERGETIVVLRHGKPIAAILEERSREGFV
ncbi:MAG: type II toxin-antitoxin system Phd/YefM family antitoxin [Planctomycetia bacterium]|nr:type II toxin-antitoxin system Phd/YefM family antitoxin [Planctomycetia bacterium]